MSFFFSEKKLSFIFFIVPTFVFMKIERNKNLDEKKPRNGIKIESRKERIIKIL